MHGTNEIELAGTDGLICKGDGITRVSFRIVSTMFHFAAILNRATAKTGDKQGLAKPFPCVTSPLCSLVRCGLGDKIGLTSQPL